MKIDSICSNLIISFLLFVCLFVCACECKSSSKCSAKRFRRADLTVAKLISFGKNGRPLPENFEMLKPFCDETTQLVHRIDAYLKECYDKSVQNVANVFIFTIRNTIKQYCAKKRTKKLTQLVGSGQCINKHLIKEDECIVNFVNQTKQLILLKEDQNKIPHTCCYYVQAMKCVERYIESVPCTAKNEELLMDFVRGQFGPIVDMLCGEYNESTNKCQLLGPPAKMTEKNRKKYISFVFVLTDLLQSMKGYSLST